MTWLPDLGEGGRRSQNVQSDRNRVDRAESDGADDDQDIRLDVEESGLATRDHPSVRAAGDPHAVETGLYRDIGDEERAVVVDLGRATEERGGAIGTELGLSGYGNEHPDDRHRQDQSPSSQMIPSLLLLDFHSLAPEVASSALGQVRHLPDWSWFPRGFCFARLGVVSALRVQHRQGEVDVDVRRFSGLEGEPRWARRAGIRGCPVNAVVLERITTVL